MLAGLFAVSAVATAMLGAGEATTVYYATYTRMGEIVVGSLLAVAVSLGVTRLRGLGALAAVGGALALVAMAWCWVNLEQETPLISQGGLLVYALLSGTLVLAACVPGPVRRLLGFEPLRLLGLISYGVYLVHWPIFLVLDGQRTGLDQTPLFVLRVAVTLAVAIASYFLLEKPIRRGWSLPRVPMPALAGVTVVAVTLIGVVVPRRAGQRRRPPRPGAVGGHHVPGPVARPRRRPASACRWATRRCCRPAEGSSPGATRPATSSLPYVALTDALGCPVSRGGEVRAKGDAGTPPAGCFTWAERIPPEIQRLREVYGHVDFAVIQTGPWEVTDRRIPGDDQWRAPGDPVYDDFLYREFSEVTDRFIEQGLVVVWILSPNIDVGRNEEPPPSEPYAESDPARMERLNEIVERVADDRTSAVTVDLPATCASRPGGEMDADLRPDGVHFDAAVGLRGVRGLAGSGDARRHRFRAQPTGTAAAAADPRSVHPAASARHGVLTRRQRNGCWRVQPSVTDVGDVDVPRTSPGLQGVVNVVVTVPVPDAVAMRQRVSSWATVATDSVADTVVVPMPSTTTYWRLSS